MAHSKRRTRFTLQRPRYELPWPLKSFQGISKETLKYFVYQRPTCYGNVYAVAITPLIHRLKDREIRQVWFADDATAGGNLTHFKTWAVPLSSHNWPWWSGWQFEHLVCFLAWAVFAAPTGITWQQMGGILQSSSCKNRSKRQLKFTYHHSKLPAATVVLQMEEDWQQLMYVWCCRCHWVEVGNSSSKPKHHPF